MREKARERIYKRSLSQQHINHSALGTLVTKQSAIFSLLFDDPNLPLSPLVPADSNQAKKKAMFSGFHFVHQHYSTAQEGRRGGDPVYGYLFHLDVLPSTAGLAALQ